MLRKKNKKQLLILNILLAVLVITKAVLWQGIYYYDEASLKEAGENLETVQYLDFDDKQSIKKHIIFGTRNIKPNLTMVPRPISYDQAKALAMGDEELLFRIIAMRIQTVGDSFGRNTPLKSYNYEDLYKWWDTADKLNPRADIIAFLVGFYFGATPVYENKLNWVVKYLEQHGDNNYDNLYNGKWWWYRVAVLIAQNRLEDFESAKRIAEKLWNVPKPPAGQKDIPISARQTKAFVYEKIGDYKESCQVMLELLNVMQGDGLEQGEINFMMVFLKERVESMKEKARESGSEVNEADLPIACRKENIEKLYDIMFKSLRPGGDASSSKGGSKGSSQGGSKSSSQGGGVS